MTRVNRRKLKESDVTFTVEVEPEGMPFRGNAMASGDENVDNEVNDAIESELASGNEAAWCRITVTAGWIDTSNIEHEHYYGCDCLGGCSFLSSVHEPVSAQIKQCVDDHGMRKEALADLQRAVNEHDRKQADSLVIEAIRAVPEKTIQSWVKRGFKTVLPLAKAELKARSIR